MDLRSWLRELNLLLELPAPFYTANPQTQNNRREYVGQVQAEVAVERVELSTAGKQPFLE